MVASFRSQINIGDPRTNYEKFYIVRYEAERCFTEVARTLSRKKTCPPGTTAGWSRFKVFYVYDCKDNTLAMYWNGRPIRNRAKNPKAELFSEKLCPIADTLPERNMKLYVRCPLSSDGVTGKSGYMVL